MCKIYQEVTKILECNGYMRYVTGELLVSGVCYHVNEMLPTIGYGCELVCFFVFRFFSVKLRLLNGNVCMDSSL
jgi:hypothetical protein